MHPNTRSHFIRRLIGAALALLLAFGCLCAPSAPALATASAPDASIAAASETNSPYQTLTFNIDGRMIKTYYVEIYGMQREMTVALCDGRAKTATAEMSYYSLLGNIHDCLGVRVVADFDVHKGKPNSVPWEPLVWLSKEEKWSSGVMENEGYWDEADRYVGDLLFWDVTSFSFVTCAPAKRIRNTWSVTQWLGLERVYFATPEAATDYYHSING